MEAAPSLCLWREDDEAWQTECGNAFSIEAGTPVDNGMRFCCYCGQKLVEVVDTTTRGVTIAHGRTREKGE